MPDLFLDHDVPSGIVAGLASLGHSPQTAFALRRHTLGDEQHLLYAAQRGWVLVTRNQRDFVLLHRAWQIWFDAFQVPARPSHAGIIIIPQVAEYPGVSRSTNFRLLAADIDALLRTASPNDLANHAFVWQAPPLGWMRL